VNVYSAQCQQVVESEALGSTAGGAGGLLEAVSFKEAMESVSEFVSCKKRLPMIETIIILVERANNWGK